MEPRRIVGAVLQGAGWRAAVIAWMGSHIGVGRGLASPGPSSGSNGTKPYRA
ncbi:MAG TPA: hypothetical protein VGQ83_11520 [Polyangia bacterium]|jgi:hypothetical protein